MTETPFDSSRFVDFLTVMRRNSKAQLEVPGFDPGAPVDQLSVLNILLVGAGGIGCELLHALAVSPLQYCNYYIIDMDTIDLSNLNRQFLFREEHIGKPKSNVCAEEIVKKFPNMRVTPIFGPIQSQDADFYRSFHFIFLGLDSVPARQWINQTVCTLNAEQICLAGGDASQAPPAITMIDGGTEGYKGSVRRIEIGKTPCIECLMYQFPPAKGVPMCTLENIPRNPAHCVLYVMEKTFKDELPFGKEHQKPDGDDLDHIAWIAERAIVRQKQFKIEGTIDIQFTQGVVKNIVPAVGFSNALVAASMVNEALKFFMGYAKPAMPQIQYDGSCSMGIGSTTPMTFSDPECHECAPRKSSKFASTTQLSSLPKLAWDALTAGTPSAGAPMPSALKVNISIDLQNWTIYPHDHALCLPDAKGGSTVSIKDARLVRKDGTPVLIGPETVMTVELSIITKAKEEKKKDGAGGGGGDAALQASSINETILGKSVGYVMVMLE